MRVLLAGATGVIGVRLVPLLIAAGHEVVGLTRTPEKVAQLEVAGAAGVTVDILDANATRDVVAAAVATVETLDEPAGVLQILDAGVTRVS